MSSPGLKSDCDASVGVDNVIDDVGDRTRQGRFLPNPRHLMYSRRIMKAKRFASPPNTQINHPLMLFLGLAINLQLFPRRPQDMTDINASSPGFRFNSKLN